jgi:uroporphyrinogen decarboxylase
MLTSRERVILAIRHKEPDMVPVDLGGMDCSGGIHALALKKLCMHLGLHEEIRVYDVIQMLAEPPHSLLKKFRIDVVSVLRSTPPSGLTEEDKKFKDYSLLGEKVKIPEDIPIIKGDNGYEYLPAWFSRDPEKRKILVARRSPSTPYFEPVPFYAPLKDVNNASEIKELPPHPWIPEYSKDQLEILRKNARYLYEKTDYAIFGMSGAGIFEVTMYLLGFETFFRCLKRNKSVIEKVVELLLEHNKVELRKYLDSVGEYIQVVGIGGEDLGGETGPFINPKEWRELFRPAIEELVKEIKSKTKCYVMIHSCGSIKPFIPDFIEMGIDVLNPVQISAKGMDPYELKKEFGDNITFWGGGCDTQHILPFASPREVKEHVKKLVNIFKEGGGFIFNQVHNIQPGTPPENIIAMFEAVNEVREY